MNDTKKNQATEEAATVKKAMISQPMAGKTDEEIAATRDLAAAGTCRQAATRETRTRRGTRRSQTRAGTARGSRAPTETTACAALSWRP